MRPLTSALLLLASGGVSIWAADAAPAACSAEEAVVLATINAYRADPVLWDGQVTAALRTGVIAGVGSQTWSTYLSRAARLKKAAPPVVWDAKLTQVARAALARYAPAAEGSPNDLAPDLAALGMTGTPLTSLLLAEGQSDLRFLLEASLVHCIQEVQKANSVTKLYAHENLMQPGATACGIALGKTAGQWRLAVVLGDQVKGRASGGIAFRDANHNGMLDPGEAPLPVSVALPAGAAAQSFASGVWTVPLAGPAAAAEGSAAIGAFTATFQVPAQPATAWALIPAPEKADIDEAKKLVAAAAKAKPDEEAPDKAVFDVALRRPLLALDSATAAQVAQAASPAAMVIDRARREFLDGINDDKAEVAKRLSEIQRRWKGRGGEWISFARSYHQLNQQFGAWGRLEKDDRVKGARELVKAIDQLAPKNTDAVLWGQIANWRAELDLCLYAADRDSASMDKKDDKKKPKK